MTEKSNTKGQIIEAALDLFSVKGFEATSMSQIADAVGIKKASLYSHFSSKQDILDSLVDAIHTAHEKNSFFLNVNWDDKNFVEGILKASPEEIAEQVAGQIGFTINHPFISRVRKMSIIEQFQNAEMAKTLTEKNYEAERRYYIKYFQLLIERGLLKKDDPEIMAAQFCAPITVWLNLCDRDPSRQQEIMPLLKKHVIQFFRVYKA